MADNMIQVDEVENQEEAALEAEEIEETQEVDVTGEDTTEENQESEAISGEEQPVKKEEVKPAQPVQPKEKEMCQVTATAVININKRTATLYTSVTHDIVEGLAPINIPNVPIADIQTSIENSIHQLFEQYNVAVIKEKEKKNKVTRKASTTKSAAKPAATYQTTKPVTTSIDDVVNKITGASIEQKNTSKPAADVKTQETKPPKPVAQTPPPAPAAAKPAPQPKTAQVEKKKVASGGQMGFEDFFGN